MLPQQAPIDTLPKHIAIVMDGNGRWARSRGMPRLAGHHKGSEVARSIVTCAGQLGIDYLTLYAFSSENWRRPEDEVSGLMSLLSYYLEHELKELSKNNVRLRVIGERSMLPGKVLSLVERAEDSTRNNQGLTLIMALSYGSRAEIVQAMRVIADKVRNHQLDAEEITEEIISQHLYTYDIPDPDLFIRTSGEQRISNYLLWQMSYTELFFTPKYWPDFTVDDFKEAIQHYTQRDRRFGQS